MPGFCPRRPGAVPPAPAAPAEDVFQEVTEEDDAADRAPLLPAAKRSPGVTSKEWWLHLAQIYEEPTEDYKAPNPSPFMLLGMHAGLAVVQLLGIFSGYAFLVANAQVVFPKCSNHTVLDHLFHLHTGQGWLCEIASIMLWTFPLFCSSIIFPMEFWDFCDSRFYYECLRAKILLNLSVKPFFASPVIILLITYFIMGVSTLVFNGGHEFNEWKNIVKGLLPFFLPVFSFLGTVYCAWDLKYYLITLANFASNDLHWVQDHIAACVCAEEYEVKAAYLRLDQEGRLPYGGTSAEVFGSVATEIRRCRASGMHVKPLTGGLHRRKVRAMFCGMKGNYIIDLLWIPTDMRAVQFRLAYRILLVITYIVTLMIMYLSLVTIVQYLELQGHIDARGIGPILSLKSLMLHHATAR